MVRRNGACRWAYGEAGVRLPGVLLTALDNNSLKLPVVPFGKDSSRLRVSNVKCKWQVVFQK